MAGRRLELTPQQQKFVLFSRDDLTAVKKALHAFLDDSCSDAQPPMRYMSQSASIKLDAR